MHNIGIHGDGFRILFSYLNGGLVSYVYGGVEMIKQYRNRTSGGTYRQ